MRRKLAISIGIISLAILGGLVTSKVAGGSDVDPPPLALADQESMPVGDENGPLVCNGTTVTAGYVREHVLNVDTLPPTPSNPDAPQLDSPSSPSSPSSGLPENPIGEHAVGPWYVFRCINDQVLAIPVP